MAQILKGAPVVAAMNEANAARCAALKEKGRQKRRTRKKWFLIFLTS